VLYANSFMFSHGLLEVWILFIAEFMYDAPKEVLIYAGVHRGGAQGDGSL